ncbi:MAG: hypothetical protein H7839_21745 [Magnetococcus sp. YQC-5]
MPRRRRSGCLVPDGHAPGLGAVVGIAVWFRLGVEPSSECLPVGQGEIHRILWKREERTCIVRWVAFSQFDE